jgi:hypothetical protein
MAAICDPLGPFCLAARVSCWDSFPSSRFLLLCRKETDHAMTWNKTKGSRSGGPNGSQIASKSSGSLTKTLPAILRVGRIRSLRRPWSYSKSSHDMSLQPSARRCGNCAAGSTKKIPQKNQDSRSFRFCSSIFTSSMVRNRSVRFTRLVLSSNWPVSLVSGVNLPFLYSNQISFSYFVDRSSGAN